MAKPAAALEPGSQALVLGATGQIGNAVVRELLAGGLRVTAASRGRLPADNLAGLELERVTGDAADAGPLEEWLSGCELVIDAAAPFPLNAFRLAGEAPPLERALARTEALLAAVARHGCRLGFVSSFTTLSRPGARPSELPAAIWRRLHPYFEVKRQMEAAVLAAARHGLPVAVVNPTTCLGPGDVKPRRSSLVALLLSQEAVMVAEHRINVIDSRDVARGLVAALAAERYGEPILLAGHNLRVGELVDWICEAGGAAPPRWRSPALLTAATSYLAEGALALLGRPSPSPALIPLLLCEQSWLTPSRAQTELGVVPRPLSATIADTVAWHRRLAGR